MEDSFYNLHQAAFDGDLKQLKKEIEKRRTGGGGGSDFDVNIKDGHGNSALILAIHNKHHHIVEYLLTVPGLQPLLRSTAGWTPLQEALASGDIKMVSILYRACQVHFAREIKSKIPLIVAALKEVPDFSVEIQWGFCSWIPFVSRFCPSDRYKIWKKGPNMRIDSTLIGYENLQWIRGSMSAIFNGENKGDNEKTFFVIDHHQKVVDLSMVSLSEECDTKQQQQEVEELMKLELLYFDTSPSQEEDSGPGCAPNTKINLKPCLTWTGAPKTSNEAGYPCTAYEMEGLTFSLQQRIVKERFEGQLFIDNSVGDSLKGTFADYIKEDKGKTKALLYLNEILIQKDKCFKGIAHLSREFPLKVANIIPLLELFPSPRVDNVREIFRAVPENQFPVKIEVPVFPTVTATVAFEKYTNSFPISEDLFSIPSEYTILSK